MKVVSASTASLLKIDFAEALLRSRQIIAGHSAAFEQAGALGIACVSYLGPVPSFKPARQAYHGIGYRLSGAATVRTDRPRGWRHGTGRTGMTAVVPADEASSWASVGAHEMIHFYLAAGFLDDLAAALYEIDLAHVELQEAGFHHDAVLARYALNFHARLREPDLPCELELNACAQLLGAHLLRHYSDCAGRRLPGAVPPLPPARLRAVTDYIWAHLDTPLRLAELAAVAGMDPFRFTRAFLQAAGTSPHKYVMQLRLARAQELLRSSSLPLSSVALSVGFSSQSHLSTCIQRAFGSTPGRYRHAMHAGAGN